jgi:uncharacterized protein
VIRVALDANVIAAGFVIQTGLPARVLNHWLEGRMKLVISEHIVKEVEIAWNKPYWGARFTQDEIVHSLKLLSEEIIPITIEVSGIASHSEGDPVIATAVSGAAAYLVTGDKELRAIGSHEGVMFRTPQEFLEEFEGLS